MKSQHKRSFYSKKNQSSGPLFGFQDGGVSVANNPTKGFAAPRQRTNGRFRIEAILNTGAATFTNGRIRPTNLVDPGFSGGTTAPFSGQAAWTGLYRKYRLVKFKTTVTFINLENFSVSVWLVPVNFDPGTTLPVAQAMKEPLAKEFLLSPKGGEDRVTLVVHGSVAQFGGVSAFPARDDSYSGSMDNSTAPINNIYSAYGISNSGGVPSVSGVDTQSTTDAKVDYYELQT